MTKKRLIYCSDHFNFHAMREYVELLAMVVGMGVMIPWGSDWIVFSRAPFAVRLVSDLLVTTGSWCFLVSVLGGQPLVPGWCKQHRFYFTECWECDAEDERSHAKLKR